MLTEKINTIHTDIKACNNKIEQGENNALFYVCVRPYPGEKTLFVTFIVNSQCCIASVKPTFRDRKSW